MSEITRRRTIRPSTRKKTSVNYRVHIDGITASDTLIVHIDHEKTSFKKSFKFRGADVIKKKSLGFKVDETGSTPQINWITTQPLNG
jgi:hypothetical protein